MLTRLAVLALSVAAPGEPCFPREAALDPFTVTWFCKQLVAAQEEPLTADPAYRFTYIPTFHPTRVAVVFLEAGQPTIVGKVLSGQGGYEPGSLVRTTRRPLDPDEWRLLQQRLENAGFWEDTDHDDRLGLDGARWVLEGRQNGHYKLRDVWSPDDTSFPQYRKVGAFMLELGGIKPPPHELY